MKRYLKRYLLDTNHLGEAVSRVSIVRDRIQQLHRRGVVGAAVFLSKDPNGPFQPFTTLPIQIFNWIEQPSEQFRAAAAAGIVVLLTLLLVLNATAIILRQRFSRRLQG